MFVLYSTRREARELVREAKSLGLTRKEFVWIATQPVIIRLGFIDFLFAYLHTLQMLQYMPSKGFLF